jgi:hypothetical protein
MAAGETKNVWDARMRRQKELMIVRNFPCQTLKISNVTLVILGFRHCVKPSLE